MAWYDVFPSWLRRRRDDAHRAIDEARPPPLASRRTPTLPDAPAAKTDAPAALGPSAPASGHHPRGTHLTIPLVGPAGMTLEQRQAAVEIALRSRAVGDVLREHQLSIVGGGLAAQGIHERAAALGMPEGKAPWMLTVVLQSHGGGNPTLNTHPRLREAVGKLYGAAADGLQQSTGAAVTHDHRLFEMLNSTGPAPMRLGDQEKTDAALRATLTLVRTLEGTGKPLPSGAVALADRLAIYYGDATIDPRSGRATPPDARTTPAISSDARRDFLETARLVLRDARSMGVADPQMETALAAMQTAGQDTTPPRRRAPGALVR